MFDVVILKEKFLLEVDNDSPNYKWLMNKMIKSKANVAKIHKRDARNIRIILKRSEKVAQHEYLKIMVLHIFMVHFLEEIIGENEEALSERC
jgi:hypothetical protein